MSRIFTRMQLAFDGGNCQTGTMIRLSDGTTHFWAVKGKKTTEEILKNFCYFHDFEDSFQDGEEEFQMRNSLNGTIRVGKEKVLTSHREVDGTCLSCFKDSEVIIETSYGVQHITLYFGEWSTDFPVAPIVDLVREEAKREGLIGWSIYVGGKFNQFPLIALERIE